MPTMGIVIFQWETAMDIVDLVTRIETAPQQTVATGSATLRKTTKALVIALKSSDGTKVQHQLRSRRSSWERWGPHQTEAHPHTIDLIMDRLMDLILPGPVMDMARQIRCRNCLHRHRRHQMVIRIMQPRHRHLHRRLVHPRLNRITPPPITAKCIICNIIKR